MNLTVRDAIARVNEDISMVGGEIEQVKELINHVMTEINNDKATRENLFNQREKDIKYKLTVSSIDEDNTLRDREKRLKDIDDQLIFIDNHIKALYEREKGLRDREKGLRDRKKGLWDELTATMIPLNERPAAAAIDVTDISRLMASISTNPILETNLELPLERKMKDDFLLNFRCELHEEFIAIPSDFGSSGFSVGTVMELNFLAPLRVAQPNKETFLPEKIYVRQSMKEVFDLFRNDVGSKDSHHSDYVASKDPHKDDDVADQRTVLIGSPGVGKSVLFFLAALFQAQSRLIAYYRRTRSEKKISAFIMLPNSTNSVRVLYSREVKKGQCKLAGGLVKMHTLFDDFSAHYGVEGLYSFVDGPRHSESDHTLEGTYDYFCASGGHPPPKQEEQSRFRRWVLSGWTKDDAIAGLNAMKNGEDTDAKSLYQLCGGSIRNMLEAHRDYAGVKEVLDDLIPSLSDDQVVLALESTESQLNTVDRFRMMFRGETSGRPVQIVDSEYMLHLLCQRVSIQKWFTGYTLGLRIRDGNIKGAYFERCIHKWFDLHKPPPIKSVCWSKGSTEEGMKMFRTRNEYWIPSVPNFPYIDSSLVIGQTMYAFQITCKQEGQRKFEVRSFYDEFVTKVLPSFQRKPTKVHVLGLIPSDSKCTFTIEPVEPQVSFTLTVHSVDMTSMQSFDESMRLLPCLRKNAIKYLSSMFKL